MGPLYNVISMELYINTAEVMAHYVLLSCKVINSIPYRPVRPEYTVPTSNPVHSTPLFRTEKYTDRTGLVPANFGQYRPVPGVQAGTEKSFFFFFLSFVIFEFLLGQNGNLFVLTY